MEKLTELSKVLKALSDKTRLKIITFLSYRPHCVCELSEIIGYSQPTISRHLQILAEAGIVRFKKEKFFIIYYLAPENEFVEGILKLIIERVKEISIYNDLISQTTPALSLKGLENFQEVF